MKQYLRTILPDRLRDWLDSETSSPSGIRILTEHILRRFPDVPRVEGFEYASALIPSASMFFCKGVVRSDLFLITGDAPIGVLFPRISSMICTMY